MKRECCVWTKR
jgi:hypothetical protein